MKPETKFSVGLSMLIGALAAQIITIVFVLVMDGFRESYDRNTGIVVIAVVALVGIYLMLSKPKTEEEKKQDAEDKLKESLGYEVK